MVTLWSRVVDSGAVIEAKMDTMATDTPSCEDESERASKLGRTNNGKGMGGKTDSQPSLGEIMAAITKSGGNITNQANRLEKRIGQMEDNMNNRISSLEKKTAEEFEGVKHKGQ